MNLTVGAIGIVVLAIIAGVWALVRRIKKGARAEVRAEVAENAVDNLRKQADAAANAPTGKPAIIERLRKGGGL